MRTASNARGLTAARIVRDLLGHGPLCQVQGAARIIGIEKRTTPRLGANKYLARININPDSHNYSGIRSTFLLVHLVPIQCSDLRGIPLSVQHLGNTSHGPIPRRSWRTRQVPRNGQLWREELSPWSRYGPSPPHEGVEFFRSLRNIPCSNIVSPA